MKIFICLAVALLLDYNCCRAESNNAEEIAKLQKAGLEALAYFKSITYSGSDSSSEILSMLKKDAELKNIAFTDCSTMDYDRYEVYNNDSQKYNHKYSLKQIVGKDCLFENSSLISKPQEVWQTSYYFGGKSLQFTGKRIVHRITNTGDCGAIRYLDLRFISSLSQTLTREFKGDSTYAEYLEMIEDRIKNSLKCKIYKTEKDVFAKIESNKKLADVSLYLRFEKTKSEFLLAEVAIATPSTLFYKKSSYDVAFNEFLPREVSCSQYDNSILIEHNSITVKNLVVGNCKCEPKDISFDGLGEIAYGDLVYPVYSKNFIQSIFYGEKIVKIATERNPKLYLIVTSCAFLALGLLIHLRKRILKMSK
ncbi:hypothetical protein KIH39_25255 [Telmatocola sphagniphila]|uniref:Uncharacterized protein n=1 Tax=Telmatocola sphagniphila TaxID=1123043 RepID=A0A8E6ET79_9BACT|nr:hypothetical protein [Telmatocola sphagniphila]QVL32104.1 hypothetical protein KIH39_25255 [Telmatocola sphagniphila]